MVFLLARCVERTASSLKAIKPRATPAVRLRVNTETRAVIITGAACFPLMRISLAKRAWKIPTMTRGTPRNGRGKLKRTELIIPDGKRAILKKRTPVIAVAMLLLAPKR